jgi:acetyltransferase-like isoleucine patch superfamily enzyme
MHEKLLKKIKKSEPLDLNGLIFQTLYLVRSYVNRLFYKRLIYFACYIKGVKLGKDTIFYGNPIIRRYPNSSIIFGNGCKFNSARNSLAIGLHQPCAFVTLNENAEIIFGNNSGASGVKILAKSKIKIGNNVLIGAGCTIMDNDSHHSDPVKREHGIIPSRPINIEDNVFIGLQCVILKGVTIGKNSVIGARSVVFNDIPENSIAFGNPCKVIMQKKAPEII